MSTTKASPYFAFPVRALGHRSGKIRIAAITEHGDVRQGGVASSGQDDRELRRQVPGAPAELHGGADNACGHLNLVLVLDRGVQVDERHRGNDGRGAEADGGHLFV